MLSARRAAFLAPLLLAACAPDRLIFECPPKIQYSAQFQKEAAAQLAELPPESPVAVLVTDYGKTRKALDVCQNGGAS